MKIKTRDMILVALFTALTAIGAFIKIPIQPAPITLQFLFTALSGVILGSKLGALSQLIYVVLGLIGIPIFTKPSSFSYIFEPTFGYLIGFIIGAFVIGKISETTKRPTFKRLFIACISGIIVIYAVGVPYLYIILKYVTNTPVSIFTSLKIGFIIFLPGDIIKSILTSIIGFKVIPIIKNQILS